MPVRYLAVCVAACLMGVGFVGCSGRDGPPKFEGPPVRVVCTTTIVADVVQRVGGDRVQVQTLMGPGKDPHNYISGAGDRKKLDDAHLVFLNGLHLEGKMADLFEKNNKRWRAYAVTDGIDRTRLLAAPTSTAANTTRTSGSTCKLWSGTINVVKKALSELDPDGAAQYERNAAEYAKELEALDAEVRKELEAVPKERRVLVTSHDAFGYFGRAYGFEVIGLQGVSTASETRDDPARQAGRR